MLKKINWEGITVDTLARFLFLLVTLANMILKAFNLLPFEISQDEIYNCVSAVAVVIAAIIGFWKNNSFTEEAQKADEHLKLYKEEGLE